MRISSLTARLLGATLLNVAACGSSATGPADVACHTFLLSYGAAPADTITDAQGLKYIEISPGSGAVAAAGQTVDVNYSGYLLNGTRFDTSCTTGVPALRVTLGAQQVITGFDTGIRGMKPGGVRRVIIPPELGYGNVANGPIPANSTLVFDIQLIAIVN